MVLHKKHQVLKTIRDAIIGGDSMEQAKSLCILNGFSIKQINETLALFEEFKEVTQFENEDFWEILSFEIFNLALQNKDFELCIDSTNQGSAIFDLHNVPETLFPLLDKFRLLDICNYSGYNLIIDIPENHLTEIQSSQATINAHQFEEILAKKKALGLEGELFVLSEEQNRLGSDFKIEHTAQLNVGAGYDIQSWKDDKSFAQSNRLYIEVKTISTTKKIYLTENEIATAKRLGANYRLYIVSKVKTMLLTYKVIDNFAVYFERNKSDFIIKPTYLHKV